MAIDPVRVKSLSLAAIERADPIERAAFLDRPAEICGRLDPPLAVHDRPALTMLKDVTFDAACSPSHGDRLARYCCETVRYYKRSHTFPTRSPFVFPPPSQTGPPVTLSPPSPLIPCPTRNPSDRSRPHLPRHADKGYHQFRRCLAIWM